MRFCLLSLLILINLSVYAQIDGYVFDEHGHVLIGASVALLPDSVQSTSDSDGYFSFDDLQSQSYTLHTSYLGYISELTEVDLRNKQAERVRIRLRHDTDLLETVVISDEHAKQEETMATEHVNKDFFQKNMVGSFAKSIEKLAGISSINVGVGIAKPVIRGLSANRIIVNHQGVKQESQQWGSDHGLEIDQFDAERIEIIKGPGSLQYGSDGLGGVINIMPSKILPKNTMSGSLLALHKTNNEHWGGSAKIGANINNWFASVRYTRQDFADYKVPASIFTYNSFDLPIFDNRLKNTAGDEENISVTLGTSKDWGVTRLSYSHYQLQAGLFSGAVGIPRSYALTHDGNYRDIDVPQQQVDHFRYTLNQTLFFGNDHVTIDVGFQRNLRKELSEPEFHSIPLSQLKDPNDKTAIDLTLETFSIATHYEHRFRSDWKNIYGISGQWQNNSRGGFEYLLPNFKTFRGGIYSISERQLKDNWLVNGGLRVDLGTNKTNFYRQYIWDSNENIIDSLISIATDDNFVNWSASLGSNISLWNNQWSLKVNIGKSFRVPYPAETVSNGIHHGTFRHEVGTPDLKSEQGYQFDAGVSWDYKRFRGSLSGYFNYFDNYIYLGPTFPAQFSPLPEAGQIYQYRQDDAMYSGFELQWEGDIFPKVQLKQSVDFVQSYNPETKLALPFTPPPAIRTDVTYSPFKNKKFDKSYIEVEHQYHWAATGSLRIDRSERPTPAYQLWDIGLGTTLKLSGQEVSVKVKVQNVFDTEYLAHLSRYRVINVPEQGRNVVVSLLYALNREL